MSIANDHKIMKDSFLESKDIINLIFQKMNAPEEWQIEHLTFDELVAALYKILGLYTGEYREPSTAESKYILSGKFAYDQWFNKIEGTMPIKEGEIFIPSSKDQIIKLGQYLSDDQIIKGDINLIQENIRTGKSIFNINGTFTSDATATPEDLLTGKTAYVNGEKIVGNIQPISQTEDFKINKSTPKIPIQKGYYSQSTNAVINDFDVVYFPNNGDEAIVENNSYDNQSFNITNIIPQKENADFLNWNTKINGSGTSYNKGQTVSVNGTVKRADTYILYAQYKEHFTPMAISLAYSNDGKLSSEDSTATENCIVTVSGGTKNGHKIIRKYDIEGYRSKKEYISDNGEIYSHQFIFNEPGFYPIVITHTDETGDSITQTAIIKITYANGSISSKGSFTTSSGYGNWFDSKWIPTQSVAKGCYINKVDAKVVTSGHSGGQDVMAVFGEDNTGKQTILYDFNENTNVGKQVDTSDIGTNAMVTDHRVDVKSTDGSKIRLTHKDIGNSKTIDLNIPASKKIKKVRILMYSDHEGTCISNATITYDLSFDFDADLYKEEKA